MNRLLALLALFLLAAPTHADELRPGYMEFTQVSASDWRLVWRSPVKGGFTPSTQPVLPDLCKPAAPPSREFVAGNVVTTLAARCTGDVSDGTIGLANFEAAQSDVLVRVAPLNRPVQALRLTPAEPKARISTRPDRWQVATSYFIIGIDHIVFGYDHLLFVVALVLLLSGFWRIAAAVTAFTVAHSLTLVGTTLGLLGLPSRPVESVIALSILFLAVEIAKRKPGEKRLSERVPWLIAFAFGLLHGFGFAGALQEIGLPESDVPTALLAFNLGVEAGQLAIVAFAIAALAILRRRLPHLQATIVKIATYAIGMIASFWFIERSLS